MKNLIQMNNIDPASESLKLGPIELLQTSISEWLQLDWDSLKSCPAKKPHRGKFGKLLAMLDREDDMPEPPLADWLAKVNIVQTGNPGKTWCLRTTESQKSGSTPEVKLERAIVRQLGLRWSNQLVVSSGFNITGRRRAIDLVQHLDDGESSFRFIELKAARGTNNPVLAAAELIQYGILYSWFRDHQRNVQLPPDSRTILAATHIEFEVLAPREYYTCGNYPLSRLLSLERKLDRAFSRLGNGSPSMGFCFAFADFPLEPQAQIPLLQNSASLAPFANPSRLRELS